MRTFLILVFLFILTAVHAQLQVLPAWFRVSLKNKGLEKKFALSAYLKNQSLQDDFNGDSIPDVAVSITEKATKKQGILLIHGKTKQHFLFGAGNKVGNETDNLVWASTWQVYKKRRVYVKVNDKENGDLIGDREIKLYRPAILVEGTSAENKKAGLIYWDGKKYVWINQGD